MTNSCFYVTQTEINFLKLGDTSGSRVALCLNTTPCRYGGKAPHIPDLGVDQGERSGGVLLWWLPLLSISNLHIFPLWYPKNNYTEIHSKDTTVSWYSPTPDKYGTCSTGKKGGPSIWYHKRLVKVQIPDYKYKLVISSSTASMERIVA